MNTLVNNIRFDHAMMWVELKDMRCLGVPLKWFPKLQTASTDQLINYELSPAGIHWDGLNEDISIDGLLSGYADQTKNQASELFD
jgi:hypothetical protein